MIEIKCVPVNFKVSCHVFNVYWCCNVHFIRDVFHACLCICLLLSLLPVFVVCTNIFPCPFGEFPYFLSRACIPQQMLSNTVLKCFLFFFLFIINQLYAFWFQLQEYSVLLLDNSRWRFGLWSTISPITHPIDCSFVSSTWKLAQFIMKCFKLVLFVYVKCIFPTWYGKLM